VGPTSNTPEGTQAQQAQQAQPESAQQHWAPWPGSDQPYPPQLVYPPPPEAYQSGGWPRPAQPQPGVYPPPPTWYQPGQSGRPGQTQYPQWSAPATDWPGYTPPPGAARPAQMTSRAATGTAVVGWIAKLAVLFKVALPLLSVLLSFVAYAALWGWQFGLGIIVLLFVHEMGHFIVIRAKGLPASLPVFIPLLGAYVAMRKMPLNVRDEAEIGIAGPVAGTAAGLACLWLYAQFGLGIMLPLAYFSFFLNLLNLIPVSPLDGARVTSAISKWIWPLGLIGMVVGVLYTGSLLLIILLVIGFFQMIERFRVSEKTAYYQISAGARVYITAIYFGLIGVLVYASYALHPFIGQGGSPF
jgi:Zn-dependent protease